MKPLHFAFVASATVAAALAALVGPCGPGSEERAPSSASPADGAVVPIAVEPTARPRARAVSARGAADPDETNARADSEDVEGSALHTFTVRAVAAGTRTPVGGATIVLTSHTAVTGPDGTAKFERLTRGTYYADARARGFLPKSWRPFVAEESVDETVELEPGVEIPVEVVGAGDGLAIAAACVRLETAVEPSWDDRVVTDARGRAVALVPPESPVLVTTSARGRAESLDLVRTAALGAAQPTLRITLAPAGTLRGVVRDPKGRPTEGARVHVRSADDDVYGTLAAEATGPDGVYEVGGLAFGRQYVAFARRSSMDTSLPTAVLSVTAERPVAEVDLRLRSEATFHVDVLDADGAPARDLLVKLADDDSEHASSGRTGSWEGSSAPGRYTLSVWTAGHVPHVETIDLVEGEDVRRSIRLSRGAAVSGVVVDETGTTVQGVFVCLRDWPAGAIGPHPFEVTAEDGRFTLSTLATGTHEVLAQTLHESGLAVVARVTAPSESVRLVLARHGTLSLRVVSEDGRTPAPNARIAFCAVKDGDPWRIDRPLPRDGRVTVEWREWVHGEIEIAADGFVPVTRSVSVPAGAVVDLGDIAMRPACPLTGVVRTAAGDPDAKRSLVATGSGRTAQTVSVADGRFSFNGFPPGPVSIGVEHALHSFRVDLPTEGPIVLTLPATGLLQVVVGVPGDPAAAGRRIAVREVGGTMTDDGATDIQGRWSRKVAAGRFVVELEGGCAVETEVRPNDATLVRLR